MSSLDQSSSLPRMTEPVPQSYRSSRSMPIAQALLARDIEDAPDEYPIAAASSSDSEFEQDEDDRTLRLGSSYRRPSVVPGPRPIVASLPVPENRQILKKERKQIIEDERELLVDNALLQPRYRPDPGQDAESFFTRLERTVSKKSTSSHVTNTGTRYEQAQDGAVDEASALLASSAEESARDIEREWEAAIKDGKIHTTWQREAKVLARYSKSLVASFILQYSLTVASIFTVGHLGKIELGAVSLASMTANITGYAVYQGLATSLDTLCAQAYGSGRKKLVGLQMQRMLLFLWCITLPIAMIWAFGEQILLAIVPEKETARLAGLYLKVLILGAPGYAAFESGKRFVQAQGLFAANLYVLLFCAPLNALMNYLFVWKFGWGFVGAPIAVVITENLLPLCLFLYVCFVDGKDCWGGLERRAFKNWGPMVRLALPGLLMIEAEFLAFEILTLSASWISSSHLAAQSVLSTITALTYQIPFPISIAASTRIANLIGATLSDAAKTSAKVALVAACLAGILNALLLSTLRNHIPQLFTSDESVRQLVAGVLPLCAAFQLFDALAASCNGILRGLGRQEIGGWVNLACYYAVAMPISFSTGFALHWGLYGLWAGPAIALGLVAGVEGVFLFRTSWQGAVEDAKRRNIAA